MGIAPLKGTPKTNHEVPQMQVGLLIEVKNLQVGFHLKRKALTYQPTEKLSPHHLRQHLGGLHQTTEWHKICRTLL